MPTIIIGAIVLICIGLAAYSVYKSKKKGNSCGCGCFGCDKTKSGSCH